MAKKKLKKDPFKNMGTGKGKNKPNKKKSVPRPPKLPVSEYELNLFKKSRFERFKDWFKNLLKIAVNKDA